MDEGSLSDELRRAADEAATRGRSATEMPERPSSRSRSADVDPEVRAALSEAVGSQRATRLADRLAHAASALDRERFEEARRVAGAIAKEVPGLAEAHETYALASYRLGRYRDAVRALTTAHDLRLDPAMLPVLADCYRALERWNRVDEVWLEIRNLSPNHEFMSEGRIVAASALADRGDLAGALKMMEPATTLPKKVRDHHLREWYVLGDLHDRSGDTIAARRWFRLVADADRDFADIDERLRHLGR